MVLCLSYAQDELFLHMFEQYGDVTFLLLLCGYKVNINSNAHLHTNHTTLGLLGTTLERHTILMAGQWQDPSHGARPGCISRQLDHDWRTSIFQGGHERRE